MRCHQSAKFEHFDISKRDLSQIFIWCHVRIMDNGNRNHTLFYNKLFLFLLFQLKHKNLWYMDSPPMENVLNWEYLSPLLQQATVTGNCQGKKIFSARITSLSKQIYRGYQIKYIEDIKFF